MRRWLERVELVIRLLVVGLGWVERIEGEVGEGWKSCVWVAMMVVVIESGPGPGPGPFIHT